MAREHFHVWVLKIKCEASLKAFFNLTSAGVFFFIPFQTGRPRGSTPLRSLCLRDEDLNAGRRRRRRKRRQKKTPSLSWVTDGRTPWPRRQRRPRVVVDKHEPG